MNDTEQTPLDVGEMRWFTSLDRLGVLRDIRTVDGSELVARVFPSVPRGVEIARFIAAAPDVYQKLDMLLGLMDVYSQEWDSQPGRYGDLFDAMDHARQAQEVAMGKIHVNSDITEPLPCPWCGDEKIMAEGTETRMAMVCQKCLARGPEVNVPEGRGAAVLEWNKAIAKPRPILKEVLASLEAMVEIYGKFREDKDADIVERARQIVHANKLIRKRANDPTTRPS